MRRTCSDCGQPLLVKNTAREHYTMGQGYSYRCKGCAKKLVAALIGRTRAGLGLPR